MERPSAALKAYVPPLEITQPGRRRVWPHPELRSRFRLSVLTLDELPSGALAGLAAAGGRDRSPRPGGELESAPARPLRHGHRTGVHPARPNSILLTNSLFVEYSRGYSKQSLAITFATPEAADGCFWRIWRRLGEGCKLVPRTARLETSRARRRSSCSAPCWRSRPCSRCRFRSPTTSRPATGRLSVEPARRERPGVAVAAAKSGGMDGLAASVCVWRGSSSSDPGVALSPHHAAADFPGSLSNLIGNGVANAARRLR